MSTPAGGAALSPTPAVEAGGTHPALEVFFSPSAAMDSLARRPRFLVALLIVTFISTVVMTIAVQRGVAEHFIRHKIESDPRMERLPADQREQIIDRSTRGGTYLTIFGGVAFPAMGMIIASGIFLLLAKVTGATGVSFRQMLAVVAHSWLPHAIAGLIALPILFAKESNEVDLQNMVPLSNLGFLFSPTEQHKLYLLASSVDLFSFWVIFLLVLGVSRITRKSKGSVLPIVVIPWALFVAFKIVTG